MKNYIRSDFYEFATPSHVWAARCPHCEQTVACIADMPDLTVDIHRDILRWKREGLIVERAERTAVLARLYRCVCADARRAARNG